MVTIFPEGTFNAEMKRCTGSKADTPLLSRWSAGRQWDVSRKAMQAHGSCLPLLSTAELQITELLSTATHSPQHALRALLASWEGTQPDFAALPTVLCAASCLTKLNYTPCPASALYSPCPSHDLLTAGTTSPSCQRTPWSVQHFLVFSSAHENWLLVNPTLSVPVLVLTRLLEEDSQKLSVIPPFCLYSQPTEVVQHSSTGFE